MKIERVLSWIVLTAAFVSVTFAKVGEQNTTGKRVAKQIHSKATLVDSANDHKASETGFHGGDIGHGHGKFFQDFYMQQTGPLQLEFGHVCEDPHEWEQRFERKDFEKQRHQGQATFVRRNLDDAKIKRYQHNPEHDHYEFGYRRGNEHHFQERYEKAHPHHGHFKTKARWGDKHGGYGEHYWDYNHAGHGHEDGGDDHGEGGYSEPVPNYHPQPGKVNAKRELEAANSNTEEQRVKRQHKPKFTTAPRLVFDLATGQVIDEVTGQAYVLKPVH